MGKGIYFTDSFAKAFQYTADRNAPSFSSKFVLICEVALGNTKEVNRFNNNLDLLAPPKNENDEVFQSVYGLGRQGPELKKFVTLADGAKIPIGKMQNYNGRNNTDFQFNEYVVPLPDQVRFRYLVQVK